MRNAAVNGGILVVVMALVAGCGKGTTSSAGMAASVAAATVGGIVGASAKLKKRPSLEGVEFGSTIEHVDLAYTNHLVVPVDRVQVDLPGRKRARGRLRESLQTRSGQRPRSGSSRSNPLAARVPAR